MLEIIKPSERVTKVDFSRQFDRQDIKGAGYSFPCDESGKVDRRRLCKPARENLQRCLDGTYAASEGLIDRGVRRNEWSYRQPAIARCTCGHDIALASFTNTCANCGADYDMSGCRLAARSLWGEETGETASEILAVGHCIS